GAGTTTPQHNLRIPRGSTGNKTFTANWEIINYSITYLDEDGESFDENDNVTSYNIETPNFSLKNPTKAHHTFLGWTGTDVLVPTQGVRILTGSTGARKYTAHWRLTLYNVTWYANDGSNDAITTMVAYNKPITAPDGYPSPREGYEFKGWSTAPNADVSAALGKMDDENGKTFYAVWEVNHHDVIYVVDGVEHDRTSGVEYGAPIEEIAAPSKEGYTFSGWSAHPTTMPDADVTISGTFTINTYTITFVNYDNTELQSTLVAYGEMPQYNGTTPEKPATAEDTYTFVGWSPEVTEVTADATYTAQFANTKNVYTITFEAEDGTVVETVKGVVGATFTVPDAPEKLGYTFKGWSNLPATIPAENVSCKATYTVNQYSIIFEDVDGSIIAIVTDDYGAEIEAPVSPSKTGFTFDGWSMVIPSTMPAENLVIVVKWKDNAIKIKPAYVDTDGRAVADASNIHFCNGNAVINYEVLSGSPKEYTIEFEGGDIPAQRGLADGKSVVIDLPKTLDAGSYNGYLVFTDYEGESSGQIPVKVVVTLPYYTIVPLYDDVAAVNAHAGDFTAYQWMENSQILMGETGRLLQRKLDTSSEYTALVTLADGRQYETCPLDMSRFEGVKKRTMINVYPNPAVANSEITVEITQNYMPEADKSITIYSMGGTLIERISSPEQINTIRLQGGIYSVVYVQNGEQVVFKLIVH
ncbi:MAG: InlB B-repeat-containing protein, partial [Bacteroidales bacterium]|nr:InlB B-repeat-containing protein [Bacteroidales bacterium]